MKIVIPIIIGFLAVTLVLSGYVTNDANSSSTKIDSKDSLVSTINIGSEVKCTFEEGWETTTIYFTKDKYLILTKIPGQGIGYNILDC